MKKIYSVCILLFYMSSFAQAPVREWNKTFGSSWEEEPYSIQQTSDGGYIIGGYMYAYVFEPNGDVTTSHGDDEFWILKLDASGTIEWQKCFGGSMRDRCVGIFETPTGYTAVGTSISSNGDVSTTLQPVTCWMLKIDSNGNILSDHSIRCSYLYNISPTSDGGFLINGNLYVDTLGMACTTVKIDASSNPVWGISSDGMDLHSSQCPDGGYIIATQKATNNNDVKITKLNANGNLMWTHTYGGSGNDVPYKVIALADGSYLFVGGSSSSDGGVVAGDGFGDCWVVKLDATGEIQWQTKQFGGTYIDFATAVTQANDGGFIVGGATIESNGSTQTDIDCLVFKLSAQGELLWKTTLGGENYDMPKQLISTNDGGFALLAHSGSYNGDVLGQHGNTDYWVVKFSSLLSVEDDKANSLSAYPNPVQDYLKLQMPDGKIISTVSITDASGKQVVELRGSSTNINVENLAAGIYFLEVVSTDQKFQTKFIKK